MGRDKCLDAVCFNIEDNRYGVPLSMVYKVITHDADFIPAPWTPPHILGVIVFEGDVIPVISVAEVYEGGRGIAKIAKRPSIIIIEYHGERAGIFAEGRLDFCRMKRADKIRYIDPEDLIAREAL